MLDYDINNTEKYIAVTNGLDAVENWELTEQYMEPRAIELSTKDFKLSSMWDNPVPGEEEKNAEWREKVLNTLKKRDTFKIVEPGAIELLNGVLQEIDETAEEDNIPVGVVEAFKRNIYNSILESHITFLLMHDCAEPEEEIGYMDTLCGIMRAHSEFFRNSQDEATERWRIKPTFVNSQSDKTTTSPDEVVEE